MEFSSDVYAQLRGELLGQHTETQFYVLLLTDFPFEYADRPRGLTDPAAVGTPPVVVLASLFSNFNLAFALRGGAGEKRENRTTAYS
jgi:hypothetical protein